MDVKIKEMDLLTVPDTYMIAHCNGADFNMNAGVARQIDKKFDMVRQLREAYPQAPVWPCCLRIGCVYNLITKEKYSHKPKLDSVRASLQEMKRQAIEDGVTQIAMPKIGSGLDRLRWEDVEEILRATFADTDIEILVCVLPARK